MEEEDFERLALGDRLKHKSWKARQSGYEELSKLFRHSEPSDPIFKEYTFVLKQAVSDSNQMAQESGLSTVFEYLCAMSDCNTTKSQIVPVIVEKCLASTRAGTRSKSLDILLKIVEIDGADYVMEVLLGSLDHKTPKNVAASISTLKEILQQFGSGVFTIKPVIKALPKLFDHRDKNVRQEAQNLTVELYRWVRAALLPSLNELKPVQLKDLNGIFESIGPEKAVPTRYRRGCEPKASPGDTANEETPEKETEQEPLPDAYDLADPIPFIDKIPKSFYSDVLSTKWKERKECLEQLLGLVSFPKLEDGKYFELINILAKRLQDPNVIVLVLAADIIDKMGSGLKSSFSQYKNILLPALLERTKEKKQNVLEALRRALGTLFASINRVSEIIEDVSGFIVHANPNVKKESIDFLIRCFQKRKVNTELSKGELKMVSEKLLKAMEDSVSDVRDSAAGGLAVLVKRFSERTMSVYTERLEKVKFQKVLDLVNAAATPTQTTEKSKEMARSSSSLISKSNSPKAQPKAKESLKPIVSKPTVVSKPKSIASSRQNSSSSVVQSEPQAVRFEFTDEGAEEYVQGLFAEDELKELKEGNWKSRLTALHAVSAKLNEISDVKPEGIIRFLLKSITWKENNFQVMTVMVNLIQSLAKVEKGFGPACATLVAGGLVEKLGDMKIKKVASNCLDSLIECSTVELVLSESYSSIKGMKSPKIIADCLLWMNQVLKDFGILGVNVKSLVDFVKTHFDNAAAPVRANASAIIVTLYQLGKQEVRNLINEAPANILSSIDAEISKSGNQQIVPTKSQNTAVPVTVQEEILIPKSDLAIKISPELLQKLGDNTWKERKEALEEFARVLDQCNNSILPNLSSDIIASLKTRITDSNKNLSIIAVEICGNIARAMGKPFDRYVKTFIGPIISLLADQKQVIRNTVISNLEKIVDAVGLGCILQNISLALGQDQPQIRKDLLKWLIDKTSDLQKESTEIQSLVPPMFSCLQDRNSDVRKSAQNLLAIVAEVVDVSSLRSRASDLYQGSQLSTILSHLDSLGATKAPDVPKSLPKPVAPRSPSSDQRRTKTIKPSISAMKKEVSSSNESLATESSMVCTLDLKGKDQRAQQDRGVLKWIFDSPRRELVDLLSEQCQTSFSNELQALLFSTNHYKEKDILAGLKLLDAFLTDPIDMDRSVFLQIVTCNADLILKYLTIRFFDTNTSIFIKSLEVLEHLLSNLDEAGYLLNEYEASSFLPFFINKMGDPKESMRIKLRAIVKQIGRVYPVSKLFVYLMKGLDSKNSRTRAECLDELCSLVQRNGQGVFVPSKCVSLIASQVGDRDASVRNSALNLICQIQNVLDEDINQYFSKISEKEKDLINERIKRQPNAKTTNNPTVSRTGTTKKLPIPSRGSTPVKEKTSDAGRPLSPGLPVVKQFALDFDKLDLMIPSKKESSLSSMPSIPVLSSMNSTSSMVSSSMDEGLEARIEIIVQQVSSPDLDTNLEGARHLEKLLVAHPNNDIVRSTDVVGVMNAVSRIAFSNLNTMDPLNVRLCKLYTTILVQIFSSKESAAYVPYSSMEDCVRKVLTSLVDPDLQNLDTTKSLPRALNMLMVRMIDNCEPNRVFRALLHLLKESVLEEQLIDSPNSLHQKFIELSMKCLWKITKVLPNYLKSEFIRVDELLSDINSFLTDLPPPFWKRKVAETKNSQIDMPLRTVKTILHELVNGLEENILQYTYMFAHEQENHVVNYLNQMLLNVRRKKGLLQERNDNAPKMTVTADSSKLEVELDEIFAQVSDKDQTKVGIQRLYELRKQHPQIQTFIDQKLGTYGSYFQGYVRRSLANLSQEDLKVKPKVETSVAAGSDYSQTLKNLQKMFHDGEPENAPAQPSPPEPAQPIETKRESRSLAVKELKERLARMKMSMKSS